MKNNLRQVNTKDLSLVLIIRIRRKNTTVLAVLTVFLHDTAV